MVRTPAVSSADLAGALEASRAAPPTLDGLPAGLAPVVARAMSSDPMERYADAAELREAMVAAIAPPDPDAVTTVLPVVVPIPVPGPSDAGPVSDAVPPTGAEPVPVAAGRASPDRRRGALAVVLGGALGLAALAVVLGSNLPTGATGPIEPGRGSAAPSARRLPAA